LIIQQTLSIISMFTVDIATNSLKVTYCTHRKYKRKLCCFADRASQYNLSNWPT